MKKYTILFSIFLYSAVYVFGQVQTKDKLNQSQQMNEKAKQSHMNDNLTRLQVYDDFEGNKVLYYGARTGTLDTVADNPTARMSQNNMNNNSSSNRNNANIDRNNNVNDKNDLGQKNTGSDRGNNTNTGIDSIDNNNTHRNNTNTESNNMSNNNNNANKNNSQTNSVTGKSKNSVNNSLKCGKYVRSGKSQFDYIKMNLKGKLTDVSAFATHSGNSKIKMKVYTTAPAGTLIEIQLGKKNTPTYPAGINSQYQAYTTISNAWEEIEFNFSQTPKGSETMSTHIDQITLLFNPGTTTSDTYYFDDIMGATLSDKSVSVH